MPKFPAPTVKYYTTNRWAAAKQPGVDYAWRVLYDGQHVGWLLRHEDGWTWRTDGSVGSRPQESKRVFSTWQTAAERLAHSAWARRVAGKVVKPSEWIPAQGKPWLPAARPTGGES